MAQRSRKRGQRAAKAPRAARGARVDRAALPTSAEPGMSRNQRKDAVARAQLAPLAPGERPWPVVVSAALALVLGLVNLISYAVGARIAGKHPSASGIVVFSLLMLVCAAGIWRKWYGAVLGFMVLLAIIIVLFSLLLVEASNLLGFIVAPLIILVAGTLFWKLVRILGRIQMPTPPGRT